MTLSKIISGNPIVNGGATQLVNKKLAAGQTTTKTLDAQTYDTVAELGLPNSAFSGANDEVVIASSGRHHAPAANTAAVVTLPATEGISHSITRIAWSYNAAPTAGQVAITVGGTEVFKQYITAAGAGLHAFDEGLKGGVGQAMVVTLAAGGADVSGALDIPGYRPE